MKRIKILAIVAVVATGSCQQPSGKSSAATLDEVCVTLTGEFRIPPDPNGPPDGNQNSEVELFRQLADPDEFERAQAAMKLLRHSERRVSATLDAAIRQSGLLGDPRVLNNLERVATQWASLEDPTATRVEYPLSSRTAAAAGIGRVLEKNRSSPPGHPDDGGGIDAAAKSVAIAALKLCACPVEPTELRSAAIEALGIARDESASAFLNLIFANPQAPDDSRELLLQALALRSLTNIKQNNHLVDSGIDEQLRELAAAIQADQGAQP